MPGILPNESTRISLCGQHLPVMKINQSAGDQACLAVIKYELGNAFSAIEEAETVLAQLHILQAELAETEANYHKSPSDSGLRKLSEIRDLTNETAVNLMFLTNIVWNRVGGSNGLSGALEKIQADVRRDFGGILKLRGV